MPQSRARCSRITEVSPDTQKFAILREAKDLYVPAARANSRSFASLRVCDFFKIAKNQRCKQYSYGDKMVQKSKKSQTLRMTTLKMTTLKMRMLRRLRVFREHLVQ